MLERLLALSQLYKIEFESSRRNKSSKNLNASKNKSLRKEKKNV